jgi:hypothetical protein
MKLDRSVRSNPQLTFAVTLPSKALPRFLGMDLLVTVCRMLEGTGVVAAMDSELTRPDEIPEDTRVWNRPKVPPRVGLIVNGVSILVEGRDRPAFNSADLSNMDLRSWPAGAAQISRTRGHVDVTEVKAVGGSTLDHNYDRAAALTVVAAAVAKLTDITAVVWNTSNCAMPAERLGSLVEQLAQGQAPMQLWLGCESRTDGKCNAMTCGLYPLLGAEIEVVSPKLPGETAVRIALELAAEILRAGEPPAHGTTIDFDKNSEFRVLHRARGGDGVVPAVVLTHVTHLAEPEAAAGAA